MSRSRLSIACLATLLLTCPSPAFSQEGTVPPPGSEADLIAVVKKADAPLKDRADACRLLALVGTKNAIAPLAALLGDEKLGHMARYALEPIPDPAVDRALRDALGTLKGRPLVGVIGSIGVRKDNEAVGALSRLLKDADSEVAQVAARSLGRIGSPAASEALEGAIDAAPSGCKLAFIEGLLRCGDSLAHVGNRDKALVIYDRLDTPSSPAQVRLGASRKARMLRQEEGKGL